MSNQWFRSWHGAPTDPKWLGIARKASVAPGIVAAIVWALLDRASQAEARGSIAGYDADGIACFMGCETEQVDAIIAIMHDKGILTGDAFTGWEKHQPRREDDSAKRVQEHRERKKTECNAPVTQCNAAQRQETLDTDTDTDTEEREKDARSAENPVHKKVAEAILHDHGEALDEWESDFLHSIKAKHSVTKAQAESLKAIQGKLRGKTAKPYALPSVKRGTAAYEAWIAYYRTRPKGAAFYEKLDALTVPSEFPPSEVAA